MVLVIWSLKEMEAIGTNVTSAKKVLYHCQIAPAHDEKLNRQQWIRAVNRLEEELGLTGQPRAVVLHRYNGCTHAHVVWSRADLEHGKCIHMSWDNRKHHAVARELEIELGLQRLPENYRQGAHRLSQQVKSQDHAQQKREPDGKLRATDAARNAWENSSNGHELKEQLQQAGFELAKGDKRGFVIFEQEHQSVYSLSRLLEVKTKEIETRCSDIDLAPIQQLKAKPVLSAEKISQRVNRRKARELVKGQITLTVANADLARKRTFEFER